MKKILAIFALALAGSAFAQGYGQFDYEDSEGRNGTNNSISTAVTLGIKDGSNSYSGRIGTSQAAWGQGNITTSYEARVSHKFSKYTAVGNFTPYIQARLGERVNSDKNFSYYGLDTGVVIPLSSKFGLDLSYRYRNAFSTSNNFQTDRYGIEGMYYVTDKDRLGLRYARTYGDSESDSLRVQYTRSF